MPELAANTSQNCDERCSGKLDSISTTKIEELTDELANEYTTHGMQSPTLTGVAAGLATNVSYWNWYGFRADYTGAYAAIDIIGYLAA